MSRFKIVLDVDIIVVKDDECSYYDDEYYVNENLSLILNDIKNSVAEESEVQLKSLIVLDENNNQVR